MSRPIIEAQSVSKRYRLGAIGATSLRAEAGRLWDRLRGSARPDEQEFWALRDVSFGVQPGEVVGIVGRNGAGKSTLLKILSRITEPTHGSVRIRGRVASLLEVGTGFHPELSGRENVFLNGAILGMSRAEVRRKFDEIVAFAEVGQFIDTPVKRYSSGMYVRLAFAVAAHLEPEILIVDEVLAVGDAQFQKKCLGKMKDASSSEGRTVLFVSHNLSAVRALCSRGILMRDGRLAFEGDIRSTIAAYLQGSTVSESAKAWPEGSKAPGNDDIRLDSVEVRPPPGEAGITIDTGAVIDVAFTNRRDGINLDCTLYIVNSDGVMIFESGCIVGAANDARVGRYRVTGRIPAHFLNAGRYTMNVLFGKDQRYSLFNIDEVVAFEVGNTATGRGLNMSVSVGVVRPLIDWKFDFAAK